MTSGAARTFHADRFRLAKNFHGIRAKSGGDRAQDFRLSATAVPAVEPLLNPRLDFGLGQRAGARCRDGVKPRRIIVRL